MTGKYTGRYKHIRRLLTKEYLEEQYVSKDRRLEDIATELGVNKRTVSKYLKRHGIPPRQPCTGVVHNLTGQRFGRLTVLSQAESHGKQRKQIRWRCLCDCGNETTVYKSSLIGGLTRSCGCLRREIMFKGYGDLSKSYWSRITKGAEKRDLSLDISIEDAWNLYLKQGRKCALSGIPIGIVTDYTHNHKEHTASLDRIDNDKGYTADNVQWVHRDLNMMRRSMPVGLFLEYCKKVAQNNE